MKYFFLSINFSKFIVCNFMRVVVLFYLLDFWYFVFMKLVINFTGMEVKSDMILKDTSFLLLVVCW